MPPSTKPLQRSAIQRTSTWTRRKPIKAVSLKRLAELPARRRCVEIVLARDGGCVFGRHLVAASSLVRLEAAKAMRLQRPLTECSGPLDVHEPGHRSQGADPTDPEACLAICRRHHDLMHSYPLVAKLLGL